MQRFNRAVASTAILGVGLFIISARTAMSSGQTGALVRLQATTPGSPQTGHLNVSGTATVGGLKMATGAANGAYLKSDATGNASWASFPSALPPSGAAGGDLTGTYPLPSLAVNPNSLAKVSGGGMFTNGSFVGVGTSTSIGSARFVVSQPVSDFGGMYVSTLANGKPFYGYAQGGAITAYTYIDGADGDKFKLNHGGANRLTIQPNGNIGIGTNSPVTPLQIVSNLTDPLVQSLYGTTTTGYGVYYTGLHGEGRGSSGKGVTGTSIGQYSAAVAGTADGASSAGGSFYTYSFDSSSAGLFASASGSAMAAVFTGKVSVSGLLSKGGGSFKIDHPLDPENKYLYHSFVESPDMMNVYNGTITTDARGYAVVSMPDYFEALNRDFRYQLTVLDEAEGSWTMARVVQKIKNNTFKIQTSNPNVEVSWQVTGIRHDNFAEANRIQPEVMKEPANRGKYLHPAEYGMPEEMGINAHFKAHLPKRLSNDK